MGLFAAYAMFNYRREYTRAKAAFQSDGTTSALLADEHFSLRQKFEMLPRVVPFVLLPIGVMVALYGGFATPSETAGLGGLLALVLIAVIYGV